MEDNNDTHDSYRDAKSDNHTDTADSYRDAKNEDGDDDADFFAEAQANHDAAIDRASDDDAKPDVRRYKLGDHDLRPNPAPSDLTVGAERTDLSDDERAALNAAAENVPNADVRDFECANCGLTHGHGDQKHDLRREFNVRSEFAEQMEFNPACHCAVHELAVLTDHDEHIDVAMFTDQATIDADAEARAERYDHIRRAREVADIGDTTEERIEEIRAAIESRYTDGPLAVTGSDGDIPYEFFGDTSGF